MPYWSQFRRQLAGTGLLMACLWGCSGGTPRSKAVSSVFSGDTCPSWTLHEAQTFRLPLGFSLTGAAIGTDGSIVAWGSQARLVRFERGGEISRIDLPGRISVAALQVDPGDSTISLFDRRTNRILQVDLRGRVLTASSPLPLHSGYVVRATSLGRDWGIGVVNADSAWFRVLRWRAGKEPELLATVQDLDSLGKPRHFLLSGTDSILYMVGGAKPFTTKAISLSTGSIKLFTPVPESLVHAGSKTTPTKWQAMAGIPLACGLLVGLTDLASDHRLFAIYNSRGQLQRTIGLSAPLGVLQQLREGAELLAVRRTGTLELVVYQ